MLLRSLGQGLARLLPPQSLRATIKAREIVYLPSCTVHQHQISNGITSYRGLTTGFTMYQAEEDEGEGEENAGTKRNIDPAKDRTKFIPVETSIEYLQSDAYKSTYGEDPVWKKYRRNFKGGLPKRKTRLTCIRRGMITAGNPCPACRDEYLVLDYRNVDLLKQFISPFTGGILPPVETNLCQRRHRQLVVAVLKSRDYGLLTHDVPHRQYDYKEYYPQWNDKKENPSS